MATAVAGTGYGWIAALKTPVSPHNWSPTSVLGRATGALLQSLGSDLAPLALPGLARGRTRATTAVVLFVWLRLRPGPVYALGLSLAAVAVLGPAIRPWYALWGLFLIAAAARSGPVRRRVAAASGVLALAVLPSGDPPDTAQVVLAVSGGVLALVVLWQAHQAARAPAAGAHGMSDRAEWLRPRTDRGRPLLVLALATAVAVFTATVPLLRDWFDLRVYYGPSTPGSTTAAASTTTWCRGTTYGFTYPPFAALGMLPMALVGLPTAIALALLLNLAALGRRAVHPGRARAAPPRLVRLAARRLRARPARAGPRHLQLRPGQPAAAGPRARRRLAAVHRARAAGRASASASRRPSN